MVLVPAGDFMMGSYGGHADEQPLHRVYVDAFYLDKYEVTNADYKKFCEASHHLPPYNWLKGQYQPGTANHPVVLVSWDDTAAYARWAGKRLPTEAEWEKAARGSLVNTKYPWGDEIKPVNARYASRLGSTDVGKYPANKYGLFDMAGNVWEWVADWYDGEAYSYERERNPQGPASGMYRVIRGGSWYDAPTYLWCAYRNWGKPDELSLTVGFRCAKSLPGAAPSPPDVNSVPLTHLRVGDPAPDFTLPDQDQTPVTFSDLWHRKNVVLIFIGPGFTGGAKSELGSYQADYVFFPQAEADVVAVTEEEPSAIKALKEETKIAFPILADRYADVAKLYGVYMTRWEMARRSTFVVDTRGTIRYVRQSPFEVDNEHALNFCIKAFVLRETPVTVTSP